MDDRAVLTDILRRMNADRQRREEVARAQLSASSIPISNALLESIAQLGADDAHRVLRVHPGQLAASLFESYVASLQIFECANADLSQAIQNIGNFLIQPHSHDPVQREALSQLDRRVQKEIFATANATHSLVDHSRRLQQVVNLSNYDEMRRQHFGDDHLHEFIVSFRTLVHHLHVVSARWNIIYKFGEDGSKTTKMVIEKNDFEGPVQKEMNVAAREYMQSAPSQIDVKLLFDGYYARATNFHRWFKRNIELSPGRELEDYWRCVRETKNFSARLWWKALIGNLLQAKTPANPYDHLGRYLTSEQLRGVRSLPHGSREQIDRIIALVDVDGICDSELRGRIYEWFRRVQQPTADIVS